MKAHITAVAHYLPPRIVTNVEIARKYPKAGTPEEIFTKTGILERRYSDELSTADMATRSVYKLLEKTNLKPEEIDCLIVGTLTADYFFPSTAAVVINSIGAKNATGYDVTAACSSFLFAIEQATLLIQSGKAKKVIVCGADRMTKTLNHFDYKTGILFGDAAASVLIEGSEDGQGINDTYCKIVADNLEDVYMKTPFNTNDWASEKFELDGQKVYKHGVTLTIKIIREYLQKHSLGLDDFSYIVPHQANIRMLTEIASQLEVPLNKFLVNIKTVGNTAGASVPLCLSEKLEEGVVIKGNRLLLVSFGAGYTLSVVDVFI